MKILILMMTCAGFYEEQGNIMKASLQSIINKLNLQDNISLYSYIGDNKEKYINEDTKTIYLTSPDTFDYTYIKTIEAFEFFNDNNFEYDFLVRINTSEFINIKLLYELCKIIKDDNKLYKKSYCCQLVSFKTPISMSYAPFAGNPILQGKFMMFSKEIIKQIIENKYILYDKKYPNAGYWVTPNKISCVDDVSISSVLNILNKDKKYNDYLSCVMNLQICINNITYDDVKKYITICIKKENDLNKERIYYLRNLFIDNYLYDVKNEVQINVQKINNPTVYTYINKHIYIYLKDLDKFNNKVLSNMKHIILRNEN